LLNDSRALRKTTQALRQLARNVLHSNRRLGGSAQGAKGSQRGINWLTVAIGEYSCMQTERLVNRPGLREL
jgi:hypothetical protein